jgi:hypothetical protein
LLGRDIKRYAKLSAKKYLVFIPKGWTNSHKKGKGDAWQWFSKSYPAVARHLLPFKSKAEKRSDQGDYWWEIRACDYYDKFEAPKISYLRFQVKPAFTLDRQGLYTNDAVWSFDSTDKYLLGLLNSRVGWFLIASCCTQIRGGFQLLYKNLAAMRVRPPGAFSGNKRKLVEKIEGLVEQILEVGKSGSKAEIHIQSPLESEIDRCFIELFDLSRDDVEVLNAHWDCVPDLAGDSEVEEDDVA